MKANLPEIREGLPSDWIANCGVCEAAFVVREADSKDNPAPHGSFCPDCKARNLIAPGVLHWSRRTPHEHVRERFPNATDSVQ